MPAIKPVSALRNYAAVLEDVSNGNPVYLTKNGYGSYAVVTMEDMDEFEQMKAALKFMQEMNKGIRSGEEEGWLTADQIRENMRARREARTETNAI